MFTHKKCLYLLSILLFCSLYGQNKDSLATTSHYTVADTTIANQYFALGGQYNKKALYDSSSYYYTMAGDIYKNIAEHYSLRTGWAYYVRCCNSIGVNFKSQQKYENAMVYSEKALNIAKEKLGEYSVEVAICYSNMGNAQWGLGKIDKAMEYQKKALKIGISAPKPEEYLPSIYNNLGILYKEKGDYEQALDYYKKSLEIDIKTFGEIHSRVTNTYNNIGVVYSFKEDYKRAKEYYEKSLGIKLKIFDEYHPSIALGYVNLGNASSDNNDYDEALEHFTKALKIYRKVYDEEHPMIALTYLNIATIYRDKDEYNRAEEYFMKALDIGLKNSDDRYLTISRTYHNLGELYTTKKEYEKALTFFNKSLLIKNKKNEFYDKDIAITYRMISSIYSVQQKYVLALNFIQKAILSVSPFFQDSNYQTNPSLNNILSEVDLLRSLKRKANILERTYNQHSKNINDLSLSLSTYQLASELADKIRLSYKKETSQLFFGNETSNLYGNAIDVALQLENITHNPYYKEQAFFFAEKNKSAVLLQSLLETHAKKFSNIPDSVLEKEKMLKRELTFHDTQIEKIFSKNTAQDSARAKELEDTRFALSVQYQELLEQLEKQYPQYYELKYQTKTATVKNIQQHLDSSTVMLHYFVGDSVLHIFAITKDTFDIVTTTIDTTFHHHAKELYERVQKINIVQKNNFQKFVQLNHSLYNHIIQPVEKLLRNKRVLVIIPDGILRYIPFEMLLREKSANTKNFSSLKYLIKDFEISYHYSAILWSGEAQQKYIPTKKETKFVGFAPVFDEKLTNNYAENYRFAFADTTLRAAERGKFKALPETETELRSIEKLFSHNAKMYFRHEASEEKFKRIANNYTGTYLHLATHSFSNSTSPQLSGIVFSPPKDSTSTEDGILYAGEIYNLALPTSLVTLSSCESGIGKEVKGEGMLTLGRGFLYAGARNVLFSLWKVNDKQTGQLMIKFYKNVKKGKSYSESLRKAKLFMLAKEETALPLYWSSFVLVGR